MSKNKYTEILPGHNGCYSIAEYEGEPNKILLIIHYQVAEINQRVLNLLLESVNQWNGHGFTLEINMSRTDVIEFHPSWIMSEGMFQIYKPVIAHAIKDTVRKTFNYLFDTAI